ncbi:MAG: hypothetical protein IJO60_10680 [Agathobacter sp.]|nr:hypothetical protein [Agathobacter sp.]
MKKRYLLLSFLLVFSMLLGACGSGNPFEGKWRGKLDVTKQFEDGIKANIPELAEYVDFEGLVFEIDVTFEDGMMVMNVDPECYEKFDANFKTGMMSIEEGSLMAFLDAAGVTLEEAVAESGLTEEEYLEARMSIPEVKEVIDTMTTGMDTVTKAALTGFGEVNGPYTFNEDYVHVRYEEDKYEKIAYSFEGDNLILIFKGAFGEQEFSLRIVCEKQ